MSTFQTTEVFIFWSYIEINFTFLIIDVFVLCYVCLLTGIIILCRPISRVRVCIIVCACVCACIWLYMCIVYHLYTTIFIYLIIFTQMLQIFHLNYISSLQQGHTILVEIPQFEKLDKYAHQFMEYLPNAVFLIIVMDIGNAGCTNNYMVICSFYLYFFLTRN